MDVPTPFSIDLAGPRPVVEVDGLDLTDRVARLRLDVDRNGRGVLTLSGVAAGVVRGAAAVQLIDDDPRPVILEFLAGIDADELERTTLERDDLVDGPGALTAAMLRQLGEWARGG